ncbi:hypothetical protein KKC97_10225 [bacterium]|nr:hypothetical protein [bacterium]MBU1638028.1 hypothetical protein [bacterium]MBU1920481.1 hypothetical protein [bacterium]
MSKKAFFSLTGVIAVFAVLFFGISCDKSDDGGDNNQTQWTIMMYGAGNNNLDVSNNNTSFIIQDVQDMEKVGSTSGMEIIAMVASERTGGRAKYYHIEQHLNENPDQISSPMLEDKGTKDMSDPATLKEFINYCAEHYPAQKYLLIVDDHGAGWPGSCSDELNGGGGMLTMPELKTAISTSSIQHVDIVCFHACLMAMVEVAYELREVADYMTACQFTMPMQNVLGADLWLEWIKNNTGASAYDVAHKIAEKVSEAAQNKQKTTHYAMIKLSHMSDLGAKIGQLGNVLVTEAAEHWGEVQHAWGETHFTQYDNIAYVDLREFTNKLNAEPTLSTINLINNAASDVRNLLNSDGAVPYTNVYVKPGDPNVPRGGLNIHFPFNMQDFDSTNYVTLSFRQTNWHAFLSTFLQSMGQQPETGRCCYNNNQSCAVTTQAECANLGGNWTAGIDCNTPCPGGTGDCPTTCATAAAITLGQTISNCQFVSGEGEQHWFSIVLNPGAYRFQLDVPNNADFDVYTFLQCADFPNSPTDCYGENDPGVDEDFTCNITGGSLQLYVLIYNWGGTGAYAFLISQAAEPDEVGRDIKKTDYLPEKLNR